MAGLDGYVRVSQTAGREGETFISPAVQRERIEAWAQQHGHEILAWHQELDESGGREDRPKWQEALARVERGETGGIVVASYDRFARSFSHGARAIERIDQAGGRLVALHENIDTAERRGSAGRFHEHIFMAMAEFERSRQRERWETASHRAVGRGVHVSGYPPVGYRRGEDGRLEIDGKAAQFVREAIRRRAAGQSCAEIARWLTDRRAPTTSGLPSWTSRSVSRIVSNRVYLGEARGAYGAVNADAHEPLVNREEWEAAQRGAGARSAPGRSGGRLLSELVRCAGCRYAMSPGRSRGDAYRCAIWQATGRCPTPATIKADTLDAWVEEELLARLESAAVADPAAGNGVADLLEEVERHEEELAAFYALADVLDRQAFLAAAKERQDGLVVARRAYEDARDRSGIPGVSGDLVAAWPSLTLQEQRRIATVAIDAVMIRTVGRGGWKRHLSNRALILWHGQAPDLPSRKTRGQHPELRSFEWPQ